MQLRETLSVQAGGMWIFSFPGLFDWFFGMPRWAQYLLGLIVMAACGVGVAVHHWGWAFPGMLAAALVMMAGPTESEKRGYHF